MSAGDERIQEVCSFSLASSINFLEISSEVSQKFFRHFSRIFSRSVWRFRDRLRRLRSRERDLKRQKFVRIVKILIFFTFFDFSSDFFPFVCLIHGCFCCWIHEVGPSDWRIFRGAGLKIFRFCCDLFQMFEAQVALELVEAVVEEQKSQAVAKEFDPFLDKLNFFLFLKEN